MWCWKHSFLIECLHGVLARLLTCQPLQSLKHLGINCPHQRGSQWPGPHSQGGCPAARPAEMGQSHLEEALYSQGHPKLLGHATEMPQQVSPMKMPTLALLPTDKPKC